MKSLLLLTLIAAVNLSHAGKAEKFFLDKTDIKSPLRLRDPFKPPLAKIKKERRSQQVVEKDYYTNLTSDDLSKLELSKLKIIGVVIGNERRAVADIGKDKQIVLKEGMKVGRLLTYIMRLSI